MDRGLTDTALTEWKLPEWKSTAGVSVEGGSIEDEPLEGHLMTSSGFSCAFLAPRVRLPICTAPRTVLFDCSLGE